MKEEIKMNPKLQWFRANIEIEVVENRKQNMTKCAKFPAKNWSKYILQYTIS